MQRTVLVGLLAAALVPTLRIARATAQNDAGPLVRLLKSGRLPADRLANVVSLVCQRGNEDDLAFVYDQAIKPDGFNGVLRRQALEGLAAAALTRKIRPSVDAGGLKPLLADNDLSIQRAAFRLAAAWKVEALAPAVAARALAADASDEFRRLAIDALLAIGGDTARQTIDQLQAAESARTRAFGVAALAALDLPTAAARAAEMLTDPAMGENVDILVDAFLERQKGTDQLATALASAKLPADTAKLALRHMYLAGRSDQALVDVLSKMAGIGAEKAPPTPEGLRALSAEALAKGDPARGEAVFRRGDLGCLKCHAVSGAGGDVGPDLSPVGSTSPIDYCITSILQPDLSIKESFLARNFITSEGMIHQGIVVDRDDRRVIVKDATGQKITIPTADVEEETEGKSLMPKGLSGFLTHQEFLDLVRFLSELGKPGPYAVRSRPTIQRWRYLKDMPDDVASKTPSPQAFARDVLKADESAWLAAYGCVDGTLPLGELTANHRKVLYLFGEVEVTQPGEVDITLDQPDGVSVWVDDRELPAAGPRRATLASGIHRVTLRVDTAKRPEPSLRVTVDKPTGSTAVYTVVGGR